MLIVQHEIRVALLIVPYQLTSSVSQLQLHVLHALTGFTSTRAVAGWSAPQGDGCYNGVKLTMHV